MNNTITAIEARKAAEMFLGEADRLNPILPGMIPQVGDDGVACLARAYLGTMNALLAVWYQIQGPTLEARAKGFKDYLLERTAIKSSKTIVALPAVVIEVDRRMRSAAPM